MEVLKGKRLQRAGGAVSAATEEALAGKKVVIVYFSAQWCPPCRLFTPVLRDFYQEAAPLGIEVIFVSSDRSAEDMAEYMKSSHGDWWAVEHGSKEATSLKQHFSISAVPTVVVLKAADGAVITKEGRAAVQSKGVEAAKEWLAAA